MILDRIKAKIREREAKILFVFKSAIKKAVGSCRKKRVLERRNFWPRGRT